MSTTVQKSLQAMDYLNRITLPPNPAIVFDIDDTLIDSKGNSIHSIIALYNFSKQLGITPIIITNRSGHYQNIEYTKEQLKQHNIVGFKLLYFRPPHKWNPWRYKLKARENVKDKGYNVVMSIGDMEWDIGKYGGVGILLK